MTLPRYAAIALLGFATAAAAQDAEPASPINRASNKATPSFVFSVMELCSRKADRLMAARGVTPPGPPMLVDTQLNPMHVYQIVLACLDAVRDFENQNGLRPAPYLSTVPMRYTPVEVNLAAELLRYRLDLALQAEGDDAWKLEPEVFDGKTPTDVYGVGFGLFLKLQALQGVGKISPSECYAQVARAKADAQAVVDHVARTRYRDDFPRRRGLLAVKYGVRPDGLQVANDPGEKTPADVYKKCLEVRRLLSEIEQASGGKSRRVPDFEPGLKVRPSDVWAQTQLVIAELNLLKLATGDDAITPPTNVPEGKTPTDVHAELRALEFILRELQVEVAADTSDAA